MAAFFEERLVFEVNTEGYPRYRIPSIIKAPNGDLLAFAEGRFGGDHDNVDLVMKRSTDNGETWGDLEVIWGEQFSDGTTFGNPSPVVDEETGTIWMTFIEDQYDVYIISSTDNGNTWTEPENISDQVKNPDWSFGPEPTDEDRERVIWTGPGIGIQIKNGPYAGRLVIPVHFQPFDNPPYEEDEDFKQVDRNQMWVFYSDDNGQTWNYPDSSVLGNEPQVVELSNNDLMLNGRNQEALGEEPFFRLISTSSDGGDNFVAPSTLDDELLDPVVQASILRYSFGSGEDNIILFANPAANPDGDPPSFRSRENMTVRLSNDDGEVWDISRLINPEFSGYSSLVRQENDNVGLLYEGVSSSADPSLQPGFGNITFASFNLEWLTEESVSPPIANDDSFDNIPENSTDFVLDVLANDSDPDGDLLTITALGNTSNGGTVTINDTSDGLLYSPAPGFVGTETFTYTLSDDTNQSDDALVTVTVISDVINNAPIANNDLFENIESSTSNISLDVLANDSDPDDDPLTIIEVGIPSGGGIVEINSNGDGLMYSPAPAFTGEETFNYTVSDGRGGNVQAEVTVTVVEDPSIFSTDWENLSGWNTSGTDITIEAEDRLRLFDNADTTTKVFRSDVDIPNTYALEFTAQVEQYTTDNKVSLGAKIQDGDFRLMFQRRSDGFYVFDDTRTWVKLRTTSEFTESADYRIEVNNGVGSLFARISGNDLYTFAGDWDLQPFRRNDLVEHWVRGVPESPATVKFDSTRILELDPLGEINNPPVAENDVFGNIQPDSIDNDLNVLNNDSDPDGDLLTISAVGTPSNGGEVFINSTQDGLVYAPADGFVGEETFNYTIVDGRGGADIAEVRVAVGEDISVFTTNWEDLEGWTTSGSDSDTDITITETGELRLFDNANTTTKVTRSDVDITGAYSFEFKAQVDRYTTDDKVSLGVKVQDGDYRLMFQRKSDGFYVIDDTNSWVKLPDTAGDFESEFTELKEYKIDVDNDSGILSSRVIGTADYIVEGEWNLQPFQQGDLIEHWVRGTLDSPAEARFDMTRIF